MILNHARPAPRRGQIAIFIALSMVAIVGTLAVSLDGGAIMSERRHAQGASDAAALAAAGQLYYWYWDYSGKDTSEKHAYNAALAAAAENGYTNDAATNDVEVNIPPKSGWYKDRDGYCEVIVTYKHTRGFSSLFGGGTVAVKSRSVAVGMPVAADVGILVLDPDDKDALSGGGGKLTVVDTPVIVNSAHAEGSIANSGSILTAPEFNLTGGYAEIGGTFVGDINLNRTPTEDPLKYLPPPDKSTLTYQRHRKLQETSGTSILEPGIYKGGINVSGTASLLLLPGIYYMENGGFSFSGQGTLTGLGVLIYSDPGNGNADRVEITGQGAINLSGMTEGIYQGMTLWQNRTSTNSASVSGNAGSSMTGTFYFAGAKLEVSGNGGVVAVGSQYISNTLAINGNGTVYVQWKPNTVGRRRQLALVE